MYWFKKIYYSFFTSIFLFSLFLSVPTALGQGIPNTTLRGVGDFKGFVNVAINIFSQFTALLIGLGVFVIIWGLFLYITKTNDPEKRQEGMRFVAYGIFGVFIMISFWGFVNILKNTFVLPSGSGLGGSGQNTDPRSEFVEACVSSGRGRYLCEHDYERPDQVGRQLP